MKPPTPKQGLALGLIIVSGGVSLFVLGITGVSPYPKLTMSFGFAYALVGAWGIGMYVATKRFIDYLDSRRDQP
jgi:hypothetical protein